MSVFAAFVEVLLANTLLCGATSFGFVPRFIDILGFILDFAFGFMFGLPTISLNINSY